MEKNNMNRSIRWILTFSGLLVLGLLLAACGGQAATPCPDCPACPEAAPCAIPEKPAAEAPFETLWAASAHAKADAAAFTHWNEESPAEIPVGCAKCHSDAGFKDYAGADGSAAMAVDKAAPVGSVIACTTCHNDATNAMTSVKFPQMVNVVDADGKVTGTANVEISGLGSEAVCMNCHQGTASTSSVDAAIVAKGGEAADPDIVVAELGFVNVHYTAAAATLYGTQVKGGYEYSGKLYDNRFAHTPSADTCTECHNSHSLEVKVETCATCHEGAAKVEDLRNIRMISSSKDYDGDGDVKEGIAAEIVGLQGMAMTALQAYAKEVAGSAIAYSADAYPYFFIDTNGDGKAGEDEAVVPNAYKSWTPRLLKAAYNYQFSIKDTGAYAHGGKYVIELLYDSIENLGEKATPVDLSKAAREDAGHFASSAMAWRDWDAEGEVPSGCAKCHSAEGLPQLVKQGFATSLKGDKVALVTTQEVSSGMLCETCHNEAAWPERYSVSNIVFPNGKALSFMDKDGKPVSDSNLCATCHQGRQSTLSINNAINNAWKKVDPKATVDLDKQPMVKAADGKEANALTFQNVHYFLAAGTLFGGDAQIWYETEGKEYAGQFKHTAGVDTCVSCHDAHALTLKEESCVGCHPGVAVDEITMTTKGDFDGDGTEESLKAEADGVAEKLWTAIQKYAEEKGGGTIYYAANSYPYFKGDTNGNGKLDPEEIASRDSYPGWTGRLLKAAYNYQAYQKDPGAFAHNGKYVIQVMLDSIQDLSGEAPKLRP
jgi:hypothetical protein